MNIQTDRPKSTYQVYLDGVRLALESRSTIPEETEGFHLKIDTISLVEGSLLVIKTKDGLTALRPKPKLHPQGSDRPLIFEIESKHLPTGAKKCPNGWRFVGANEITALLESLQKQAEKADPSTKEAESSSE